MSEDHFDDEQEGHGGGGGSRHPMAARFRGYLPVVVDVETGGFNSATDALLEIAAVTIGMDERGFVFPEHTYFFRVEPFAGANIEAAALEFTGIKLDHPLRMAVSEETALNDIFRGVRKALKANGCKRAVLVGHNASFDLGFVNAAVARMDMKRNPFHPFSSFDTATLAGLAYVRPTAKKPTRPATTPRRRPSCSAASSTAGRRWAAGKTSTTDVDTSMNRPALCRFFHACRKAKDANDHSSPLPESNPKQF